MPPGAQRRRRPEAARNPPGARGLRALAASLVVAMGPRYGSSSRQARDPVQFDDLLHCRPMRRPWKVAAAALFAAALLFGGLFGERVLALTDEARQALRLYTELVTAAHDGYGAEVSYRDLVFASINGLLRTLDPHTSFLPPDAYANMRERQQSSFYGLGIFVGMRDGRLTVITPIEGTPASRLGIRAGDVISTIEGESTETMTLDEAVRRLKGPKGTTVRITIVRVGLPQPLELEITRDEIPQTTVRYAYMIGPEIGFIHLTDFTRSSAGEMAEALKGLRQQGMKRLLLDLRVNGGGLLDQAVEVADQFIPKGSKIVETRGRTRDSSQVYRAAGSYPDLGIPLVVLVNGGTASAAEILAGAIQDHDLGLIAGTPTWGKGLVQTVYSLSYGAGLALTTAKYYTPSGRLIQRDYSSWYDYQTHADLPPSGLSPSEPGPREQYATDLGRVVFGGGGIAPDVVVQPEEVAPFLQFLHSRNAFFLFAVEYANGHPIASRVWTPGAELFEQFAEWLVTSGIAAPDELEESLAAPAERAYVLRQVRAEIFNAAFGLEARHQVLAEGDKQIQEALRLFDQATDLLLARQQLERSDEEPAAAATAALEPTAAPPRPSLQ